MRATHILIVTGWLAGCLAGELAGCGDSGDPNSAFLDWLNSGDTGDSGEPGPPGSSEDNPERDGNIHYDECAWYQADFDGDHYCSDVAYQLCPDDLYTEYPSKLWGPYRIPGTDLNDPSRDLFWMICPGTRDVLDCCDRLDVGEDCKPDKAADLQYPVQYEDGSVSCKVKVL